MLILVVFVVTIILSAETTNSGMADPLIITLNIQTEQANGSPILSCDHSWTKLITYTVYEEEKIRIIANYNETINLIKCHGFRNTFAVVNERVLNVTLANLLDNPWKCRICVHRDNECILPMVHSRNHSYSGTYCYIRFHVRRKLAPQTILVNHTVLPAVRTERSQKDVDFIAEYQYANGDVVNVICADFLNEAMMLTLEYNMAGTRSDKSTMDALSSRKMIGFVTKLHSEHNNSYMICTYNRPYHDYTKVMVRFVLATTRNFNNNIVLVRINGKLVRPYLKHSKTRHYRIEYKYFINQLINLTCEVKRTDVKMTIFDEDFVGEVSSYNRTDLIPNKKSEMRFYLKDEEKKIQCATDYLNGQAAEAVLINFTVGKFPIEKFPLHMDLPTNGRVMELYNDYKLNVIFYEFIDGETLQLKCGQLYLLLPPAPVLYLQLDSEKCDKSSCSISKTLNVTREHENTPIACYLKEKSDPTDRDSSDIVLREIRVVLRERVLTTTTSTTTTASTVTTSVTYSHTAVNPLPKTPTDVIDPANQDPGETSTPLILGCSIGAVLVVLSVAVAVLCFIRTRNAKHIETPHADLSNKNDITTQLTKENEYLYDVCHYSDNLSNRGSFYNTTEDNMDPQYHQYTEIDYSKCKPKICKTHTRDSRVYDEPYVHINIRENI